MTFIQKSLRLLPVLMITLAAWLASAGTAWAQAAAPSEKGYVYEYLLILAVVGAALTLVIRSVGRSKDIKPKQDN